MVDGSPRWFTAAVFDSHQSFYDPDPDPRATCFINIFFDLYEIERRKLEDDLAACSPCSLEAIDSLYHRHREEVGAAASLFLLRANRGNDLAEMAHWNTQVSDALGIDNMKLQGLVPQVKKE
jgi:hypothetical protein